MTEHIEKCIKRLAKEASKRGLLRGTHSQNIDRLSVAFGATGWHEFHHRLTHLNAEDFSDIHNLLDGGAFISWHGMEQTTLPLLVNLPSLLSSKVGGSIHEWEQALVISLRFHKGTTGTESSWPEILDRAIYLYPSEEIPIENRWGLFKKTYPEEANLIECLADRISKDGNHIGEKWKAFFSLSKENSAENLKTLASHDGMPKKVRAAMYADIAKYELNENFNASASGCLIDQILAHARALKKTRLTQIAESIIMRCDQSLALIESSLTSGELNSWTEYGDFEIDNSRGSLFNELSNIYYCLIPIYTTRIFGKFNPSEIVKIHNKAMACCEIEAKLPVNKTLENANPGLHLAETKGTCARILSEALGKNKIKKQDKVKIFPFVFPITVENDASPSDFDYLFTSATSIEEALVYVDSILQKFPYVDWAGYIIDVIDNEEIREHVFNRHCKTLDIDGSYGTSSGEQSQWDQAYELMASDPYCDKEAVMRKIYSDGLNVHPRMTA